MTRSLPLFVGLFLVMGLVGCDGSPESEKLKREGKDAAEAAGDYAEEKKEDFVAATRDKMSGLDKRIDKLQERAAEASGEAKQKMEETLEDLKKQRKELADRLDKLADQSGEAWNDLKQGISKGYEDLQRSVDDAMKEFDDQ